MRLRERGVIASIWLYAAGAVAVSVAVAFAVSAVRGYNAKLDATGYARGVAETTSKYQARDNAALTAAVAAQQAAQAKLAKVQAKAATTQAAIDSKYQKGVKDGQADTDKLVAAARAGALKLRDHGTVTSCPPGGNAAVPGADASTASGNGAKGAELSATAAEFLLALTGEADEVAKQLSAAQAVILSDREVCK